MQALECEDIPYSVAFSPNNELLAGTDHHKVKIWDTATGFLKRELIHNYSNESQSFREDPKWVEFSLDNRNLLSKSENGEIQIWDTETWRPTQRLVHSTSDVSSNVMFSPDSQMLASGSSEGTVNVWRKDTDTWNLKWKFRRPRTRSDLSFSPNNLLLASSTFNKIEIWNMKTGEKHYTVRPPTEVISAKFSQDCQFLFARSDDEILVWLTKDWSLKKKVRLPPRYTPLGHLAISPDNKYIAFPIGRSISVIENKTYRNFQTATGHTNAIHEVVFSSDSRLMASGGVDRIIRLWEVAPGSSADNLDKHSNFITNVVYSPDGSLVATNAYEDDVKIWDAGTGFLRRTIMDGKKHIYTKVKFSPNSKILAWSSSDGSVTLLNLQTEEFLVQKSEITGDMQIIEIHFSRSSRLVAATYYALHGAVAIWDTETGDLVKKEESQRFNGEELQNFVESLEKSLHLNENAASVDYNVSHDTAQSWPEFCISIVDGWVVLGQEKSIWLPPEYRPYRYTDITEYTWAQRNNGCVIGTQGGLPLFFWFNPDAMSAKQLQSAG